MYSKNLICKVKNSYVLGQSIGFISKNLDLSKPTVFYWVKNDYSRNKLKRGPAGKLNKYDESRIEREIYVTEK